MSSNKFVSIFDNLRTIKIKKQFNLKRTILKRNIDNKKWEFDFSPLDEGIDCEISHYYNKAYLRHLMKSKEILGLSIASIHNLAFYSWLMREARKHIINGSFVSWKKEMEILKQRI